MPTVSVLLTSYNHERHIAQSIESVLAQSFGDFELIIWDDASQDRSWEVIQRYNDPRIRAVRNPVNDTGFYVNRAIDECRGEFFAMHHSDDVWLPHKLEKQVAFLRSQPAVGAVFGLPEFIDEHGRVLPAWHGHARPFESTNRTRQQWLHRFFHAGNCLCHPTLLIRKACFDACGKYNHFFAQLPDFDMWVRLCLQYEIHVLDDVLIQFRSHSDGSNMSAPTQTNLNRHRVEYYEILRNFLGIEDADEVLKIFPELRQAYPAVQDHEPRFLVAQAALRAQGQPWMRLFGIDTLFQLTRDDEVAARLRRVYAFDKLKLRELAGAEPLFHDGMPAAALPAAVNDAPQVLQDGAATCTTAVIASVAEATAWPQLQQALRGLQSDADLYLALHGSATHVGGTVARDFPRATIVLTARVQARGAAYLELLRRASHAGHELVLCLPVATGDGAMSGQAVQRLVASEQVAREALRTDPRLGLVGLRESWRALLQEGVHPALPNLAQQLGIQLEVARQGYFAGGAFWARPQCLAPALGLNLQAALQPVGEAGHDAALEQALALAAERAGYRIADTEGHTLLAPVGPVLPWLPQFRLLPGERAWAEEYRTARPAASLPTLFLGIVEGGAAPAGQASVESLRGQWQRVEFDKIAQAADGASNVEAMNGSLRQAVAAWVGVIDAGDCLAADAWFRFSCAIGMHPEWQVVYCDEDTLTADGQHLNPHCKPDFNLDYLRSLPYIGGLLLIRRDLFEALGGFDPAREGAEDYDLLLRAWEHLQASGAGEAAIGHVPVVLYHRGQGSGHTRKTVPEILAAGQAALQTHFERLGIAAEVQPGPFPPSFRVRWPLPQARPTVSILIPTRDQVGMLQRCIESVIEKTRYPNYEILVIDNDSRADDALRYLAAIDSRQAELGGRLRVIRAPGEFNFSAMNNAAARAARGDYLLLLNNDTAALHDDWLDEMMSHALRPDVGVVGAKLLFPDGKIQHAGVILGIRGPAEHPFIGRPPEDRGYFGRAQLVQDLSAVTGACLLVRRSVYEQVAGLDEHALKVSYSDIDLCLKVRQAGLRVVFTPYALLMHEGSASQRGQVEARPDEAKQKRFAAERAVMYERWLPLLARDPAYNRQLSLVTTEFLFDDQPCLAWDPDWRPRPRILVHPADREGCGEYRIIAPMRALNRGGAAQGWETMRLFEPAEMQRVDADSLVVQRQMEWPQIEALERHARHCRALRVFEIDDLITNLPLKSVHKAQIHKDIAKRFRKAAGLCNRLVVATEPLARAYAGFSDEVVVCPNYLEGARWSALQPARGERKRLRVGWAGGIGHSGDLDLIVDVVRETAGDVDWVFFGLCPDALKPLVKEFHPGVPLDQYAPKLASLDLDLAVAPLENNAFNEAKSHLRLLEYGVLGYPVICSDITPYQGDFPVVRVANRFRDWVRAIRDAVGEPQALRAQGDALRAKVLADWIMEDHLDVWLRAWTR